METNTIVGVVGAGTMGRGIAQIAATAGHTVLLVDRNGDALVQAKESLDRIFARLIEKGRIDAGGARAILTRIKTSSQLADLGSAGLVF